MANKKNISWKWLSLPGLEKNTIKIYEDGVIYNAHTCNYIHPSFDCGYKRFSVLINGVYRSIRLNRALAIMFIKRDKHDEALHRNIVHFRDFNTSNYSLENLQWVNPLELSLLKEIRKRNDEDSITNEIYSDLIDRLRREGYSIDDVMYGLNISKENRAIVEMIMVNE